MSEFDLSMNEHSVPVKWTLNDCLNLSETPSIYICNAKSFDHWCGLSHLNGPNQYMMKCLEIVCFVNMNNMNKIAPVKLHSNARLLLYKYTVKRRNLKCFPMANYKHVNKYCICCTAQAWDTSNHNRKFKDNFQLNHSFWCYVHKSTSTKEQNVEMKWGKKVKQPDTIKYEPANMTWNQKVCITIYRSVESSSFQLSS